MLCLNPGGSTPGFGTPSGLSQRGSSVATPTPLRDKLNINPEDGFNVGDTPQALKQYQREVRNSTNHFNMEGLLFGLLYFIFILFSFL